MGLSQRSYKIILAALCVVFAAARVWPLTDSCLWFDEVFSVHAATHSWNSLLSFVSLDLIHPPLFYVLLKLWIGVGGEQLFWLRLFPVIFSVIAIFPFVALCRDIKLTFWTQILALFFLSVNGSLIKYAQEIRMYSLFLCLSLFSIWLFVRFFVKGKGFIALVLINILLVYTHYFGWFVVVSEVAAILIFQRIKWRRTLTMFAITFAGFVPWIMATWQAAQTGTGLGQNIGWMSRPGIVAILQFKLNLIEPFYYQASSADPVSVIRVSIPLLLIFAASVVFYILNWKRQPTDEKQAVHLLFIFVAVPIAAAVAVSWLLPYSIWGTRHLVIVFAPVSILLAIAITNIGIPLLRTASITLILLFSGYAFVLVTIRETPRQPWCAWDNVASEFAETRGAKLYAFEDLSAYHLWFALRNTKNTKVVVIKGTGAPEDTAYFLPRGFNDVEVINEDDIVGEQIYAAFRADEVDITKPPISNLISRGYEILEVKSFPAGRSKAHLIRMARKSETRASARVNLAER